MAKHRLDEAQTERLGGNAPEGTELQLLKLAIDNDLDGFVALINQHTEFKPKAVSRDVSCQRGWYNVVFEGEVLWAYQSLQGPGLIDEQSGLMAPPCEFAEGEGSSLDSDPCLEMDLKSLISLLTYDEQGPSRLTEERAREFVAALCPPSP